MDRWQKDGVLAFREKPEFSLKDILDWYENYQSEFHAIEEALQRSASWLPGNTNVPIDPPTPRYDSFRVTTQCYVNLAKTHLLMGDADAALKDLTLLRRLIDAVDANQPPPLVEIMVRAKMVEMLAQTIQEAMNAKLWPASHHARLQELCSGITLVSDLSLAVRGAERAGMLQFIGTLQKKGKGRFFEGVGAGFLGVSDRWHERLIYRSVESVVPSGWIDQNMALYARLMQGYAEGFDAKRQRFNVSALQAAHAQMMKELPAYEMPQFADLKTSSMIDDVRNATIVNFRP